jgi:hypothetical protein
MILPLPHQISAQLAGERASRQSEVAQSQARYDSATKAMQTAFQRRLVVVGHTRPATTAPILVRFRPRSQA